jgi:hypothetical protein
VPGIDTAGRRLAPDYFTTFPFRKTGPLFRFYTCLTCGLRLETYASFLAHLPVCSSGIGETGAQAPREGKATKAAADMRESVEAARLAELLASVADGHALDAAESMDAVEELRVEEEREGRPSGR